MTAALMAPRTVWSGMDLVSRDHKMAVSEAPSAQRLLHFAQIVLIVAIAVVLIAGIVAYSLIAYQCIKHGYRNVRSYGPNGWKLWEFKIVCTK